MSHGRIAYLFCKLHLSYGPTIFVYLTFYIFVGRINSGRTDEQFNEARGDTFHVTAVSIRTPTERQSCLWHSFLWMEARTTIIVWKANWPCVFFSQYSVQWSFGIVFFSSVLKHSFYIANSRNLIKLGSSLKGTKACVVCKSVQSRLILGFVLLFKKDNSLPRRAKQTS